MNPTRSIALLFCFSALAACGSTVGVEPSEDGGGGNPLGQPMSCELPPDGAPFTLTIRNPGTRELSLDFGCFDTPPIAVDGAGIAPGAADLCGIDCRAVYDGYENLGCSTLCGANAFRPLPPGGEVEIQWDRRVFVEHLAPVACTGHEEPNQCALGQTVPSDGTVEAVLEVCPEAAPDEGDYVPCDAETFAFDLDFAADGIVVEVE